MRTKHSKRRNRASKKAVDRPDIGGGSTAFLSIITTGSRLHADADGRSASARRWRDLYHNAIARGASEQLARSLASLTSERERMDAAIARDEPIDRWELVRLANAIARLDSRIDPEAGKTEAERLRRERAEDEAAGLL